jgi:hypothetical protein
MSVSFCYTLTAILLVCVVVLNMILCNMMYTKKFALVSPSPRDQQAWVLGVEQHDLSRLSELSAAPPLPVLLLVLLRTPQHVAGTSPPVAQLMLQLRSVLWRTPPRVVIVMGRVDAIKYYKNWCLLTELQCDIAVIGDLSPGGLVRYIHNTDMCCKLGLPTHDIVLMHEGATVRRGFGKRVARAQDSPSTSSCLLASPCQAYYIPAAVYNNFVYTGSTSLVFIIKNTTVIFFSSSILVVVYIPSIIPHLVVYIPSIIPHLVSFF